MSPKKIHEHRQSKSNRHSNVINRGDKPGKRVTLPILQIKNNKTSGENEVFIGKVVSISKITETPS